MMNENGHFDLQDHIYPCDEHEMEIDTNPTIDDVIDFFVGIKNQINGRPHRIEFQEHHQRYYINGYIRFIQPPKNKEDNQ